MKRRDFLVASTTLAALASPVLGRTGARPCPPAKIVAAGRSVQVSCPGGPVPGWFKTMPEKTWAALSSNTLNSVRPNPVPRGSHSAICTAWTGGCVDQERGELILAANGGHADYFGNEVYAFSLRSETPRWVRLTDPTPSNLIRDDDVMRKEPAANSDGRMRAVHGWHRCCFGAGRVWYAYQDSYTDGGGNSAPAIWSFDRGFPGLPADVDGVALKHDGGKGPWESHGLIPGVANFAGMGHAAFDRVSGRVWSFNGAYSMNQFHAVDVASGDVQSWNFPSAPNRSVAEMWAAVAHDMRIAVVPNALGSSVLVLDLSNPGKGLTEFVPGNPQNWDPKGLYDVPVGNHAPQYGAVYPQSSRSILIHCPAMLGRDLRRLEIPTRPDGSFDPKGAFRYSTVPGAGDVATTATNYRGTYGKFNIVEDMGDGQSALVLATDTNGPVLVYKLPTGGL